MSHRLQIIGGAGVIVGAAWLFYLYYSRMTDSAVAPLSWWLAGVLTAAAAAVYYAGRFIEWNRSKGAQ